MTFLSRMTTDTGAPMPRYLYLLLKPTETLAGGVALAAVTGWSALWTTAGVALFYVGIGLWAWYRRRRIVLTSAPGQFVGDAVYHGILSVAAVSFVTPWPPLVRLAAFLGCALFWIVLEVNNYGPIRSPSEGLTP